ncbi:MAG: hypothetical protein COS76_01015 [Candidatus Portnoybacteria bacterium CG06_land_8_20_14_3_00_39_12]|uniref:ASCH domain-containing protein n=1 Tax=Candidatus Portnoybacteria bacterium CG06_land_8_20_14_3_00_39_12 TaxID=1974809 RepID=A0A2M7AXN4_9BACT|nr:MAG: hypothetical protein COS76_01015 [Candidatus Portnoybacteria bacterium CG06_land_8_20_14_3_00_39_12]
MNGEKTSHMKQMWIKRPYFQLIKSGKKTLEGRIGYPSMSRIKKGDDVLLQTGGDEVKIKIIDVRKYESFREALEKEEIAQLLPDIKSENALELYERIYPQWKVEQYGGVLIFELRVMEK